MTETQHVSLGSPRLGERVDHLLLITLTLHSDVVCAISVIGFLGQPFIPQLAWISR